MPRPLDGLVAIAEYGSKFEVDVAVAAIIATGIDATASYDPAANSPAPYFATDRTFELLVRDEDAEAAVAVLYELEASMPAEFRTDGARPSRSAKRARLRHMVMAFILGVFAMPFLVALLVTLSSK